MEAAGDAVNVPTNVRRLQPLRVLVCGRDRRFVRVTSFLLARRGYHVAQGSAAEVVEAVERQRSDVVVLEADESKGRTAQLISALQLATASPALLLVVPSVKGYSMKIPTVTKWAPLDELVQKIETAAMYRVAPSVASLVVRGEESSL